MSEGYENVRSDGQALKERFIDLEVLHQANQAYDREMGYGGYDDYHWTHEDKLDAYQQYEAEWRDEIASWFADLDELFEKFADLPDPESIRGKANELRSALTPLAGPYGTDDLSDGTSYDSYAAYEHLPNMDTRFEGWEGDAAIAFKLNFAPAFPRVTQHEFRAVQSLKSALLAEAAMWEKGRDDVVTLIKECNAALDDFEGGRDGAADLAFALTVIGAIVAVAAVPATGGTSAALYWTMAGSALAVTGAAVSYPDEPKKELEIKGESPAELCQSLRLAASDMRLQWINDEIHIRDQLYILADTMSGYTQPKDTDPEDLTPKPRYPNYGYTSTDHEYNKRTTWEFTLPRPALADSTPGNIGDHMGDPEV